MISVEVTKRTTQWVLGWRGAMALVPAYLLLELLTDHPGVAQYGIGIWRPAAGLAFAALLIGGRAVVVAVPVACVVGEVWVRQVSLPVIDQVTAGLLSALAYGGGAAVLRRSRDGVHGLDEMPRLLRLLAAAALSSAVPAVFLATRLDVAQDATAWLALAVSAWLADTLGVVAMAPGLLLALSRNAGFPSMRLVEFMGQAVCIAAVLWLVLNLRTVDRLQLLFLLFIPLIWAAARGGLQGAVLAVLMVQVALQLLLRLDDYRASAIAGLELRILAISVTTLLLGASVAQRRQAEDELVRHQAELARMSRMGIAGELASGLAHEINQPLTAVVNYCRAAQRLMQSDPPQYDRAVETMEKAANQAERAAQIIRHLREFLQRDGGKRRVLDVHLLIAEAIALAAPTLRASKIDTEIELAEHLPPVLGDRIHFQLVLLNILRNSVDSLTQDTAEERRIIVSARPSGPAVQVDVTDTGPGFSPDIFDSLFIPFATTKESGMGLGLSLARSLVEANGGQIWADPPVPGRGAVFHLTLPAAPRG